MAYEELGLPRGYQGFAELGLALGGGRGTEEAYNQGVKERADGAYLLEHAGRERALRLAEELNTDAKRRSGDVYRKYAATLGLSPEAADLGAVFAQGGDMNFSTFMGGDKLLHDREFDRQRMEAFTLGDIERANQIAAVKSDKFYNELGELPPSVQEYQYAKGDPGFMDFMTRVAEARRGPVNLQPVTFYDPEGKPRLGSFDPKRGAYQVAGAGELGGPTDGPVVGAERADFYIQKLRAQGYDLTPEAESQIRKDLSSGGAYFNTADGELGAPAAGWSTKPPDTREEAKREKMAAALSKRLSDEQVPLIETQLKTIESSLAPYLDASDRVIKDIPGFGRLDSLTPNVLSSTEALDLRQQVAGISNVILKSRSGAAVTDPELRRFLQEAGTGKAMPEEQLIKGIRLIRRWFNAQKSNIKGGYSPEVIGEYYSNAPENSGLFGELGVEQGASVDSILEKYR